MNYPNIIFLVSGKRKSGKDFLCGKLREILGDEYCKIIRISEPLKSHYAQQHNLDLKELLSSSEYKETYRLGMIIWSDEIRMKDPGYFCRAACAETEPAPVWIVSDIRRLTDVDWFKNTYGDRVKCCRISANTEVRNKRGWKFTDGVDNAPSECNLDDFQNWNVVINNNNDFELEEGINDILKLTEKYLL